jgi:hypothetical protein
MGLLFNYVYQSYVLIFRIVITSCCYLSKPAQTETLMRIIQMKRLALTSVAVLSSSFMAAGSAHAIAIFNENFDNDTQYVSTPAEYSDGTNDYWTRTDGVGEFSAGNVYNGAVGDFFAGQDLDGDGVNPSFLNWTGINIAGFTNLQFSGFFAESDDGANQDWDEPDFVLLEFQIDGGGFQNLLAFENDGSTFNSAPFQDTDFDGTGDGPELTDTFSQFSAAIAGTGSTLDLRLTASLDSGDEDIAFDTFVIDATPIPYEFEASLGLIALGGFFYGNHLLKKHRKAQLKA